MRANAHPVGARSLLVAVVTLACVLLALVVVPGAALAGDGTSILEFEESEHEIESGETLTLEVVAYDHGDSSGDGLASLSFAVEYDPDVLTATEVEHESMLEGGDDVDLVTDAEIDDEGRVIIEQERDPVGEGATGNEAAATVTFEVHDDVGPTSTIVDLTNGQAYRPSDWPVYPVTREATIHVDGGNEDDLVDDEDDGSSSAVTFADEYADDDTGTDQTQAADGDEVDPTDSQSNDDSSDDEGEPSGDDSSSSSEGAESDAVPGFAVFGAIAGVVGGVAVWLRGRRL